MAGSRRGLARLGLARREREQARAVLLRVGLGQQAAEFALLQFRAVQRGDAEPSAMMRIAAPDRDLHQVDRDRAFDHLLHGREESRASDIRNHPAEFHDAVAHG